MNDDHGARRRSYAAVPLLIGGGLAVLLAAGTVVGITAGYFNGTQVSASAASESESSNKEPTSLDDGDETNPTDSPINPDRDSDQLSDSASGSDSDPGSTKPGPVEDAVYTIVRGDTLTSLSYRFGMSVDALARYNAISNPNVISEGATLRVPGEYPPEAWLPFD